VINCDPDPLQGANAPAHLRFGFTTPEDYELASRGADIVVFSASSLCFPESVTEVISHFVHQSTIVVLETSPKDPLAAEARDAMIAAGVREGIILFLHRSRGGASVSYACKSSGRIRRAAALVSSILELSGGFASVTWGAAVEFAGVGRLPEVGRTILFLAPGAAFPDLECNLDIRAVDLSDSCAMRIPSGAFWGCRNLGICNFPSELVKIEGWAFRYCDHLIWVDLRECSGLEGVGHFSFYLCGSLSGFELPPGVKSLGIGALEGTSIASFDSVGAALESPSFGPADSPFFGCARLARVTLRGIPLGKMKEAFELILCAGAVTEIETDLPEKVAALAQLPGHRFGAERLQIGGPGWSETLIREPATTTSVTWTGDSRPILIGPTSLAVLDGLLPPLAAMKDHLHSVDLSSVQASAIGGWMFSGCGFLEQLTFPASLTRLPEWVCPDCFCLK
jgi:hypothetical protein